MNNDISDLLQVKIEKARALLPEDTRRAIDAVDWRKEVLAYREKKKFTLTQLEDLELETELLLCGLVSPEQYPKELETRMNITKETAITLVNELNETVFKKIREELENRLADKKMKAISYTLENKNGAQPEISHEEEAVMVNAGIEIGDMEKIEVKPEPQEIKLPAKEPSLEEVLERAKEPSSPTRTQTLSTNKLTNPFQLKSENTDHSEKTTSQVELAGKPNIPKIDPYREMPE